MDGFELKKSKEEARWWPDFCGSFLPTGDSNEAAANW